MTRGDDQTRTALLASFKGLEDKPEVVNRLLSVMKVYEVDVDDLFCKWEAMATASLTSKKDSDRDYDVPTLDDVDEIQKRVSKDYEQRVKERSGTANTFLHRKEVNPVLDNTMFNAESLDQLLTGQFSTPSKKRVAMLKSPASGRPGANVRSSPYGQMPKTPVSARHNR
ncbi:hypothetical protein HK104_009758, partial [Borealophlyctis nickersoniae]